MAVTTSVADAASASQGRAERAREIARSRAVSRRTLMRDEWRVASPRKPGGYVVDRVSGEHRCGCPDFEHRGVECKHILAVRLYEAGMMGDDEVRDFARRLSVGSGFDADAAAAILVRLPRSLAVQLVRETRRVQNEAAYWAGAC